MPSQQHPRQPLPECSCGHSVSTRPRMPSQSGPLASTRRGMTEQAPTGLDLQTLLLTRGCCTTCRTEPVDLADRDCDGRLCASPGWQGARRICPKASDRASSSNATVLYDAGPSRGDRRHTEQFGPAQESQVLRRIDETGQLDRHRDPPSGGLPGGLRRANLPCWLRSPGVAQRDGSASRPAYLAQLVSATCTRRRDALIA